MKQEAKKNGRGQGYLVFKYQKRDFEGNLGFKFFFIISQFRLDIFEELANLLKQRYEPILLSPIYKEIMKMAEEGSPKMRQQVSMALKLVDKCQVIDVEKKANETHDDVIVRVFHRKGGLSKPVSYISDGTKKEYIKKSIYGDMI
jgi:rRNA-processing protein FCF1